MAIVTRFITYQIPENAGYDQLIIYSSATETGAYVIEDTLSYIYPTRATEYDGVNTAKWYKLRFYNATDGTYSPYSQPFYGGQYDDSQPFATISSSFDGAGYATVSGFYQLTNLNTDQIEVADVSKSLKIGRAFIDLITDDQSPYRYSRNWDTNITRRKYNAQLKLTECAEIYFAAALIYQDMADKQTMFALSGNITPLTVPADIVASGILPVGDLTPTTVQNISIGQTSITNNADSSAVEVAKFNVDKALAIAKYNNEKNISFARFFDEKQTNTAISMAQHFTATSLKYAARASSIIETFKPTTIPISYGQVRASHLFSNPQDIYSYAIGSVSTSLIFSTNIADLTGLGDDFNGAYYSLSVANMVANSVNGVLGLAVYPVESNTTLLDAKLVVNGVTYWLDDWIDHLGGVQAGKSGTTGGKLGFSMSFNSGGAFIDIIWNYTLANAGFDLVAGDNVTLTYWTV